MLYATFAKDASDLLPGHIWVTREQLEVQNMKYNCPKVLQKMIMEVNAKVGEYQKLSSSSDIEAYEEVQVLRKKKDKVKEELQKLMDKQTPLKWVNRIIMWCADGQPSIGDAVPKGDYANLTPTAIVEKALASNAEVEAIANAREALIGDYMK